jgi:phosphoglycolate phosphatase
MQTVSQVQSFIFDLDGTLVDSCPGIQSSLSTAFVAARRAMPATDIRTVIGPPIREIAARVEPSLTEEELVEIERAFRTVYDSTGWRETVLFEDVKPVLESMKGNGRRLFIVTNKPLIPTRNILGHLGLMHLFEEIVTRDSRTPFYESKAEMLGELVHRHSLLAEGCVMVGDTAEDEEAAATNGTPFIHAVYGYGTAKRAHGSIMAFSELTRAVAMKGLSARPPVTV